VRVRLLLVAVLAACQPYASAALGSDRRNVSLAAGGGARDFTIGIGAQVNDRPEAETMAGTASLDFTWSIIRVKGLAANIHAGPAVTSVVDMATGERGFGYGVHYGAGFAWKLPFITAFVDFHRVAAVIEGGSTPGTIVFDGAIAGIALRR